MKIFFYNAVSLAVAAALVFAPVCALADGPQAAPAQKVSRRAASASPASAPATKVLGVAASRATTFGIDSRVFNTLFFFSVAGGIAAAGFLLENDGDTKTTGSSSSHH